MLLVMADLVHDRVEGRRALSLWERRLVTVNLVLVAAALLALPAVIGIAISPDPLLLLVAAPALLLAYTLWRHGDREAGGFAVRVGLLTSLAYLAAGLVLFPAMDERKTYRHFFEEAAPRLGEREVFTTLLDDRRLPLVTYYLERRVTVLPDVDAVFARLEGAEEVALILPEAFYARHRERFASVSHELFEPTRGREYFVLVANRP